MKAIFIIIALPLIIAALTARLAAKAVAIGLMRFDEWLDDIFEGKK